MLILNVVPISWCISAAFIVVIQIIIAQNSKYIAAKLESIWVCVNSFACVSWSVLSVIVQTKHKSIGITHVYAAAIPVVWSVAAAYSAVSYFDQDECRALIEHVFSELSYMPAMSASLIDFPDIEFLLLLWKERDDCLRLTLSYYRWEIMHSCVRIGQIYKFSVNFLNRWFLYGNFLVNITFQCNTFLIQRVGRSFDTVKFRVYVIFKLWYVFIFNLIFNLNLLIGNFINCLILKIKVLLEQFINWGGKIIAVLFDIDFLDIFKPKINIFLKTVNFLRKDIRCLIF